jgi:hypothetical protein
MMNLDQKLELIEILQYGIEWDEAEKLIFIACYLRHNGNRTQMSRELGLAIRTVRNKIKKFKIGEAAQIPYNL